MNDKMTSRPHLLIIYTGGTIGMMRDYDSNALRPFDFEGIYKNIPELNHLNCTLSSVSFDRPIDSSNMQPDDWMNIAELIRENYDSADGFVVLHGSDTMAYTASALSFMLQDLGKPVIFTGSQLPVGDLRTDAKENMITSIEIASMRKDAEPLVQEVCIYFEYKLLRANRTTKISAEEFKAFFSPNYPLLGESGVHLKINEKNLHRYPVKSLKVFPVKAQNILLLKLFPGITRQVWEHQLSTPGVKAIVLETYGAGNASTEAWFVDALKEVIDRGIPVVNITQCISGSVEMGKYETSRTLEKIGVISGGDITTEAAVTKLMFLLTRGDGPEQIARDFPKPICGEISE